MEQIRSPAVSGWFDAGGGRVIFRVSREGGDDRCGKDTEINICTTSRWWSKTASCRRVQQLTPNPLIPPFAADGRADRRSNMGCGQRRPGTLARLQAGAA